MPVKKLYNILPTCPATGIVPRDVNNGINVLDFGADPNGIKDSWQAFQDAIHYAILYMIRVVYVPLSLGEVYLIDIAKNGPLRIKDVDFRFVGDANRGNNRDIYYILYA